jgi:hypothetical protein
MPDPTIVIDVPLTRGRYINDTTNTSIAFPSGDPVDFPAGSTATLTPISWGGSDATGSAFVPATPPGYELADMRPVLTGHTSGGAPVTITTSMAGEGVPPPTRSPYLVFGAAGPAFDTFPVDADPALPIVSNAPSATATIMAGGATTADPLRIEHWHAPPIVTPAAVTYVGSQSVSSVPVSGTWTQIALPTGTQVGDLLVLEMHTGAGFGDIEISCSDPRILEQAVQSYSFGSTWPEWMRIGWGRATDLSPLAIRHHAADGNSGASVSAYRVTGDITSAFTIGTNDHLTPIDCHPTIPAGDMAILGGVGGSGTHFSMATDTPGWTADLAIGTYSTWHRSPSGPAHIVDTGAEVPQWVMLALGVTTHTDPVPNPGDTTHIYVAGAALRYTYSLIPIQDAEFHVDTGYVLDPEKFHRIEITYDPASPHDTARGRHVTITGIRPGHETADSMTGLGALWDGSGTTEIIIGPGIGGWDDPVTGVAAGYDQLGFTTAGDGAVAGIAVTKICPGSEMLEELWIRLPDHYIRSDDALGSGERTGPMYRWLAGIAQPVSDLNDLLNRIDYGGAVNPDDLEETPDG